MAKPPRCRFCKKDHYGLCAPNEPVRPLTPVAEAEAPLSDDERARYDQLKSTVMVHWAIVAEALTEIRDRRLYREEHPTFEAFCQAEMGFSGQRGYQLIRANNIYLGIQSAGLPAPRDERTARALAALPEGKQTEVWRETVANEGAGASASQVRRIAAQHGATPAGVTPNIEAAEPARSDAAALRGASGPAPASPPTEDESEPDAFAKLVIHAAEVLVALSEALQTLPAPRRVEARRELSKLGQRYIEVGALR